MNPLVIIKIWDDWITVSLGTTLLYEGHSVGHCDVETIISKLGFSVLVQEQEDS